MSQRPAFTVEPSLASLRAQLEGLQEEFALLTECILSAGLVSTGRLSAARSRRCVIRAWQEVVNLPELSVCIAAQAGLRFAKNLAMASRAHAEGIRRALPVAAELAPAQLVVVGGCRRLAPHPRPGEEELLFDQLDVLDAAGDTWTPLTCMPRGIFGCTAAVLCGCLYVVGGELAGLLLNTVFMFDPGAKEDWRNLSPMHARRGLCVAAAAGGRLYVTGGHDHMGQPKGSLEHYDPQLDAWSLLHPMPTARYACAAATVGCAVYVVGGRSRHEAIRGTAEVFDLSSGTWATLPPMLTPRAGCAAAGLRGRLYVAGGEAPGDPVVPPGMAEPAVLADPDRPEQDLGPFASAVGALEVFDRASSSWSFLPPMPTPRGACAAAVVSGRFYVVGGAPEDGRPLAVTECFDPATGCWTRVASLPKPRARCAAVALRR